MTEWFGGVAVMLYGFFGYVLPSTTMARICETKATPPKETTEVQSEPRSLLKGQWQVKQIDCPSPQKTRELQILYLQSNRLRFVFADSSLSLLLSVNRNQSNLAQGPCVVEKTKPIAYVNGGNEFVTSNCGTTTYRGCVGTPPPERPTRQTRYQYHFEKENSEVILISEESTICTETFNDLTPGKVIIYLEKTLEDPTAS